MSVYVCVVCVCVCSNIKQQNYTYVQNIQKFNKMHLQVHILLASPAAECGETPMQTKLWPHHVDSHLLPW